MIQPTLYEYPLNERIRSLMRLEGCFQQIKYFSDRSSTWDTQACLNGLIEIIGILDRHDIRSEIAKESERHITTLNNLSDTPAVNHEKLQNILEQLESCLRSINQMNGRITKKLQKDDLLNSIKHKICNTQQINVFDVPGYYYWLNLPVQTRQERINSWLQEIQAIEQSVNLLLYLNRNSSTFEAQQAEMGFFQRPLNNQQTCQMIRIEIDQTAGYFPEVSGNKHRVSVRFLEFGEGTERPRQVSENLDFHISFCGF